MRAVLRHLAQFFMSHCLIVARQLFSMNTFEITKLYLFKILIVFVYIYIFIHKMSFKLFIFGAKFNLNEGLFRYEL